MKNGEPSIVIGEASTEHDTLLDPDRKPPPMAEVEVKRPPVNSILATRLEDADQELANALARAGARPTPEAHRRVAMLYQGHGILDMAYDHLLEAERLAPDDPATQDNLARLWRAWGLGSLGLGAAYRAVYLAPDSPQAWNTLGTLLQAVGYRVEARRAFERGLALDPLAAYVLNKRYRQMLCIRRQAAFCLTPSTKGTPSMTSAIS